MAARLGRRLLAIPGSAGTDRLLASGAAASVSSSSDVLRVLAGGASSASSSAPGAFDDLRRAFGSSAGPVTVEVLARRLGLPVGELLGVLYEAELGGFIARRPGGRFEVIRGH
jgi:DNA processing protein